MKNRKYIKFAISALAFCGLCAWTNTNNIYADTSYKVSNSINATLTDEGVLTVSGTGQMPSYSEISAPWATDYYMIKKIVIDEGITNVGTMAFSECYNLKEVTLASTVTSIDYAAFAETGLEKINGGNNVTKYGDYSFERTDFTEFTFSQKTSEIGNYIFYDCGDLKTINIPSSTKKIGVVAYGAGNLTDINVDAANANFKSENSILFNKDKTEILAYPAGKVGVNYSVPSTVKIIKDYCFNNVRYLEKITIPSSVTAIGDGAFYKMKALKTATIPSSVKEIGDFALEGCEALETLYYYAATEQTPYRMCMDCKELKTAIFRNDNIKTLYLRTFMNCSKLSNVTLPAKLEEINVYAFKDCKNLSTISYPSTMRYIEAGAFEGSNVKEYPENLKKTDDGSYVQLGNLKFKGKYNYDKAYEVLKLVNEERAKKGLSPLKMDRELLEAAMLRAAETSVLFDHQRPDGTDCFSACSKIYGENIACGQSTPSSAMDSWMNSSGHRANILAERYTSIGIGCFSQGGMLYWTQCFGTNEPATFTKPANKNVSLSINVETKYLKQDAFQFRSNYSFEAGKTFTLEPRIINSGFEWFVCELNPESFNWKSSNSDIASVSAKGVVTCKKNGTVTITGTLKCAPYTKLTIKGKVTGEKYVPGKAKIKYAKNSKKKTIKIAISKTKNAKSYTIQYATNSKFKGARKITIKAKKTKTTTVSIKNLNKKKTYYIRVKAVNGDIQGSWSKVKKVKVKK